MQCFFLKRFLFSITGLFLMQRHCWASQPAQASAAAGAGESVCTIEKHLPKEVSQVLSTQLAEFPAPLIECVLLYVAFSQKWFEGSVLANPKNKKSIIRGMFAIPPRHLAVSYERDINDLKDPESPLAYSRVWDVETGAAAAFEPAAFIDGATLNDRSVGVLVDDSIQIPFVDLATHKIANNVRCDLHRKDKFTALSVVCGRQLVGGLHNGDLFVVDLAGVQQPLHMRSAPADQEHNRDLCPENSVTALCSLGHNRVAVGKRKGQLRIADLATKKWSEELAVPHEDRLTVKQIVAWPNNILATLKGHPHGEKRVQIWDASQAKERFVRSLPIQNDVEIQAVAALPGSILAVACGSDIQLTDVRNQEADSNGAHVSVLKNKACVTHLALPHGTRLAAGLSNGTIQLWNKEICAACPPSK